VSRLVVYASRYGSTRGIAERIAAKLGEAGQTAKLGEAGQTAKLGEAGQTAELRPAQAARLGCL
jgi:menaquinone-dependent protoporphyrinogen IX oxidase